MTRALRVEYPGAWYHVMNRGAARQNVFHKLKDFNSLLELIEEVVMRYGIEVHAYCLMSNHYHLLIRTLVTNLSRAMRHLNGLYTQRYNRSRQIDGPLFRGRFKSILVDADCYLLQLSRYIHLNPVVAMITQKPEEYL